MISISKYCPCSSAVTPVRSYVPSSAVETFTLEEGGQVCWSQMLQAQHEVWSELAPTDNIFMQAQYLQLLEAYPPQGMSFNYVVFYEQKQPIGILYIQHAPFDASASIQDAAPKHFWERLWAPFKQWGLQQLSFEALIAGNLLVTGAHGFHFAASVSKERQVDYIQQSFEWLRRRLRQEGKRPSVFLCKDFAASATQALSVPFEAARYETVQVQPSMHLKIEPSWHTFEDYLQAMRSKYRVRVRRAQKKGNTLSYRVLPEVEIQQWNTRIYALYQQVAAGVRFNGFHLHPDYFLALKQTLGEAYQLVGVFDGDALVGFYTTLSNGSELEAHFLGFDEAYNQSHQLYLNILYRLVQHGIEQQKESINFARTALEIKSSVGATPELLSLFVRHHNGLSNRLLRVALHQLNQEETWTQRHPFK